MKKLLNFFKSSTDLYLNLEYNYNPVDVPKVLIDQLTSSQSTYLADFIKKAQKLSKKSSLHRLKVLTILALLFLHSDKFYEIGLLIMPLNYKESSLQQNKKNNDKWLDQHFVRPFQQYLMKCCSSHEIYHNLKNLSKLRANYQEKYYTFEHLFYLINLIKKLTQSLKKISTLGRYYQKDNPHLTKIFVFTVCLHLVKMYGSLKIILAQLLGKPKKYLETVTQKGLMKNILLQQLSQINQSVKESILNKYFNPYGNGIKVGLFTCDNQVNDVHTCIQSIVKDDNIVSTDRRKYIQSVQEMRDDYSISKQTLFSQISNNFINSSKNLKSLNQLFQLPSATFLEQNDQDNQIFSNTSQLFHSNKKVNKLLIQSLKQENKSQNRLIRSARSKSLKNISLPKKKHLQHMKTLDERDEQYQTDDQNHQKIMFNTQKFIVQNLSFKKNKTKNQDQIYQQQREELQIVARQNLNNPTNTPCGI